ncbi:MAG: M20/M25/M40 family metallo-hydrolase, partial [Sediminibacterium sp.]
MKITKQLLIVLALTSFGLYSSAQTLIQRDPEIEKMVKEVNADSLKSYILKMVSYGTRNTLSTQSDPNRGIGAARNWLLQKFNEFAKKSNGRFSSFIDTTTLQPVAGSRVERPVILGNVVGILKGTDTADKRIFVISGHLDNMRTNVRDSVGDAPGANDDASGCAAVIECARIMTQKSFPATIIFVTVSGEEQGLLGAKFMATKAKNQGWNIEAVLNNDIMGSNNTSETNIIDNTRIRVFSEGLPAYETEKAARNIRQLGLENDGKARQLAR